MDVPMVDVTRVHSRWGGAAAVSPLRPVLSRLTYHLTVATFPYLITPYDAIQSYVHHKYPTTVIQAVFNDFNYGSVNGTASQADLCIVFANADSGEGWVILMFGGS